MATQLYPNETIAAFQKGDSRAFATIYNNYHYTIYGFARYYLQDDVNAEDITSEVFVKLWQRSAHFKTSENILAFLRIATRNACYDYMRQQKRQKARFEELVQSLDLTDQDLFADFEVSSEVLRREALYRQVDRLPTKTRRVLSLWLGGMKSAEIARQLNVSQQTVMNQRTNAVNRLRIVLTINSR